MQSDPKKNTRQSDKDLAPLYVVLGSELLLVMEMVDQILIRARKQNYIERKVFTVDQRFDWMNLSQWGCQSSLFNERRVLDLRIPSGKPGKEGGTAIEAFCQALPSDTVTIVTLPGIDKQGRATKWFKALEQAGRVIEIRSIGRDRLPHWIKQRLEQQNQATSQDTLQFLADKVEGNLLAAHQEISKLELLYPPGQLTFEQVKNAILDVTRFDVLQLPEAMLSANMARYNRILEGLQGEGMAPPLILAILSEQIRLLIRIHLKRKSSPSTSAEQAMTALRIWPSRQKLILETIQRVRYPVLVQALIRAADIDRIIKGVAQGDIWGELLNLGLYFTTEANVEAIKKNDFLPMVNLSLNK